MNSQGFAMKKYILTPLACSLLTLTSCAPSIPASNPVLKNFKTNLVNDTNNVSLNTMQFGDIKDYLKSVATKRERCDVNTNFAKNYKGDDIKSLIKNLQNTEKKDEFTTTAEWQKIRDNLTSKSYTFVIENRLNLTYGANDTVRYDPDTKLLKADLYCCLPPYSAYEPQFATIIVQQDLNSNKYIGSNAFGASVNVDSLNSNAFGLAATNLNWNDAVGSIFSMELKESAEEAKKDKKDIGYFVTAEIVKENNLIFKPKSYWEYTGSDAQTRPYYIKFNMYEKPTFDNPHRYISEDIFISTKIRSIGAFRKSTGEILQCEVLN